MQRDRGPYGERRAVLAWPSAAHPDAASHSSATTRPSRAHPATSLDKVVEPRGLGPPIQSHPARRGRQELTCPPLEPLQLLPPTDLQRHHPAAAKA